MTGAGGWVRVFDAANPATPVDSFDIAAPLTFQNIGGRNYFYKPIIISGNEAYIYLRKVLQPGATYYVTIDAGVFTNGFGGPPIGAVTDSTTWRFTVRGAAPAAGASPIAVTADGSGGFCTVQGAIDDVPAGNTTPVTINVAPGTYREIVEIPTKHAITIHGENRDTSVISYPNNASLQIPPGSTASMGTKWRAMFGVDGSNDLVIENITLWNPSPQLSTNGQSETLRVEGGFRTVVRNATIKGLQDTLLMSGQIYVANSIIEGDVDFIWGNGVVYFDHTEIKVVSRKGYNVQARNAVGAIGYVFVGCNLTSDPNITGHVLARTDKNNLSPASMVAYVDCTMGPHIDPVGWLIDGYARPAADAGAVDAAPRTAARCGTSPTCASGSTTASIRRARRSTSAGASRIEAALRRRSRPAPRPRHRLRRLEPQGRPHRRQRRLIWPPRPAQRGEGRGEGQAERGRPQLTALPRATAPTATTPAPAPRATSSGRGRPGKAARARVPARRATSASPAPGRRRGSRG